MVLLQEYMIIDNTENTRDNTESSLYYDLSVPIIHEPSWRADTFYLHLEGILYLHNSIFTKSKQNIPDGLLVVINNLAIINNPATNI